MNARFQQFLDAYRYHNFQWLLPVRLQRTSHPAESGIGFDVVMAAGDPSNPG
jgi:hypothetical protein